MVRFPYIRNEVLKIYRDTEKIKFPLDPLSLFEHINNCKVMTYCEFARLNGCSIKDVALLCESNSGCTHYSVVNDRYLVLYNSSYADNNVSGRIRWTKAHELGHVSLKHLPYIAVSQIAEHNFHNVFDQELEKEADYFASMLLSPFPVWEMLNVKTVSDVQKVFGLSEEASRNRMEQYIKWRRNHTKTAWDNDIRKQVINH